jgi:hypothetical protein
VRRRLLERPVDDLEDPVVLPQAQPENDQEREQADDQPRAELVEVLDEAELVLV